MKKVVIVVIGILVLAVIVIAVFRLKEDNWIKDEKGVWIKHGNPASTPREVLTQQNLIKKAKDIYNLQKSIDGDLSSGPCLGKIEDDWVLDIAHNPRESVDGLAENQCREYSEGKVKHFVELDLNGEITKIK